MIPTVNNFLCCFGLETGGFIIGWLSAGSSVILGIFCAFAIAAAVKLSHHDDTEKKATVIAVIFSVFLAYSIFLLFASIQMICGISNRNHRHLRTFLILMAVGTILTFLQLFTAGAVGFFGAAIGAAFSTYFLMCVYSLYAKLKSENI